tara:strand:- start:273 stop:530 length:258 start_codon:yes stop_codon:yes gene_type:complete
MRWRIWRRREPRRCPSAASEDARVARAKAAIAKLPELTREVFFLHRFEELHYECIARRLDIDVEEVEAHIAATMIALRRALKDLD